MSLSNQKLGGILFVVAGLAFMFVATSGIRTTFFVLACVFILIGVVLLVKNKNQ